MKYRIIATLFAISLSTAPVFAANVVVDYDHSVKFSQYKTYRWEAVKAGDSIWNGRVQRAIDAELAKQGWKRVETGGDISLLAYQTTKDQPTTETIYNGLGGGFGGWGWRGFRGGYGGDFGTSTTTTIDNEIGTLYVDMFDAKSHQLIWRGKQSDALSSNPQRNEKQMDKDLSKMFQKFPPA